jgi:uncharacterized protein CbrC (UPF0167 family)
MTHARIQIPSRSSSKRECRRVGRTMQMLCGNARGYIYAGPVYSEEDLGRVFVPVVYRCRHCACEVR